MAEAEMRCAWCEREGAPAFLYWTDTPDGSPSHGICSRHSAQMLDELEALYGPTHENAPAVVDGAERPRGDGGGDRAGSGGGEHEGTR